MKKVLFAFIITILLFSVKGIAKEPFNDFLYEYVNDNLTVWYIGFDENVIIPNEINGNPIIYIGASAFQGKTYIKSIYIPESVKSIGDGAFEYCVNLSSIVLPNDLLSIEENAFKNCKSLKSIKIPESVINIGRSTFIGCTSLSDVTINNNFVGSEMFKGCTSLKTITFSENVTNIYEGAFGGCVNLEKINFIENISNIDYGAFYGCKNLDNIIINNPKAVFKEDVYVVSSFSVFYPSFYECENLSKIYTFNNTQAQRYAINNNINFIPIARVQLDEQIIKFDMPPIIENDRVLVPMRAIYEALGAQVVWNENINTAIAKIKNTIITMQIDNPVITVDNKKITLDVPPKIINDRTLVPIRAIGEAIGANVRWDEATQTVIINTK